MPFFFFMMTSTSRALQYGDFTYEPGEPPFLCTVTGYTGSGGDVVIPSTIEGLTVTAIANSAFLGESSITSITVPEYVTSIGEAAFESVRGQGLAADPWQTRPTTASRSVHTPTTSRWAPAGC